MWRRGDVSRDEYEAMERAARVLVAKENWMEAYVHYTACATRAGSGGGSEWEDCARALCNRSLMALRMAWTPLLACLRFLRRLCHLLCAMPCGLPRSLRAPRALPPPPWR